MQIQLQPLAIGMFLMLPAIHGNPFQAGCFHSRIPGWKGLRMCNSDDPPNAVNLGLCEAPSADFDYKEIRISTENWDTAFFVTWLMQILLSELLQVPSSAETGTLDMNMNFYDPE
eukprot:7615891-Ditylum_brightwellii.AAC.1